MFFNISYFSLCFTCILQHTIKVLRKNIYHFPVSLVILLCLQGEFVEDGTETHFTLGDIPAYIKAVTSGKRREGIIHSLIVNNTVIPEANER
jgi:hypothetical protein